MPNMTLMMASAAMLLAVSAGPAFAQDPDAEPMMETAEEAVMDAADAVEDAAEDTMDATDDMTDELMDEPPVFEPDMDAEPVMKDKAMMETSPAPAPSTSVTVACPEGTTAQPDGTCMITGDWDGGE